MEDNLLESLKNVRWDIAFKTFGSNHATLVGLLVDWWIASNPNNRYALEPGFTFGYHLKNIGGGICDVVLVEDEIAKGIIEVEGSRHVETIEKIGKFFQGRCSEYKTLEFGIFLAYQTLVLGHGDDRKLVPFPLNEFIKVGKEITAKSRNKQLIILILEKEYKRIKSGLRIRSEYYMGNPIRVFGILIRNGHQVARRTIK